MDPSSRGLDMTSGHDRERRCDRIRHLSRLMAAGCLGTSFMLVTAMLLYWMTTPTRTLFSQAGLANAPVGEIGLAVRALAFGISMVPLAALVYGLLRARRCFTAFAAGVIFAREPINGLRDFSVGVAASAVLKPLAGAALSVLLSLHDPAGTRALVLNIGSDTLIALIFAGTVAAVAWVMAEAMEIADENKQFV